MRRAGTPFAQSGLTVNRKEDNVRSKKATGGTKSARFGKLTQHLRLAAFTHLPMKTQAGILAMLVIGLSVMSMLINGRESAPAMARNDSRPTTNATRNAAAVPAIADPTGTTGSSAEFASNQSVTIVKPVTITGCLEQNDDRFRLKDTSGDNAPKSRSWKSGFLRKGPAPIQIVDASHRLKLTDHVGKRVTVTGVLVDREMRARSVQRVAPSCTTDSKVKT
jgi:hypothetical protein